MFELYATYIKNFHPELLEDITGAKKTKLGVYSKLKQTPLTEDTHCSLCGRHINEIDGNLLYQKNKIYSDNFTEMDIWRRSNSSGLCTSCIIVMTVGYNLHSSIAVFQRNDGTIHGTLKYDPMINPWYRFDETSYQSMFCAIRGTSYRNKHWVYRAREVYDPQWIGLWHGDYANGKMMYVSAKTAKILRDLEDEWMESGYPDNAKISSTIFEVLNKENQDIIGWTSKIIHTRKKNFKKNNNNNKE